MSAYIINDPADLIEAAAAEIDVHGWCQKEMQNCDGNICIAGGLYSALIGLNEANDNSHIEHQVELLYSNTFDILSTAFGRPVSEWNDKVCADQDEAVETLRQIAKKYREEHSS